MATTVDFVTTANFVRYFDELDQALAPELVAHNVDGVEWHGDRVIGLLWAQTTGLLSGILTVRRQVEQGALWVEGIARSSTRDYPVRFPLLVRSVRLRRDQNGNPVLDDPGPWRPHPGFLEADAQDEVASVENPHADRGLRDRAAAFIARLDASVYRVRLRAEYGLWAPDRSSATLFPFAGGSNLPNAFGSVYGSDADAEPDVAPDADEVLEPLATPVPLNREQRFAALQAREGALTVISGPPGTGKTHVLSAILFEQLAQRRATLVVTATEPAREAIETMLSGHEALPVVRFGRDISPVVLGNALAERATSLRVQGRHHDLIRALDEADEARTRLRARARHRLGGQSLGGNVDFDELNRLRHPRRWWRRRRGDPSADQASVAATTPDRSDDLDAVLDELWETERRRRTVAVDRFVSAYLASVKPAQRRDLAELARALRLDPMERRDALGTLNAGVVAAAPIWLGTLDAVDTFLPPVESMFDLVLFDEASQISQLDAVGALRRARRAAVVGDPHQMRHTARTSAAQRDVAAARAQLSEADRAIVDERELSLYDAAASVAPVHRLVDHYRSSPHIIAFSNQHFYGEELRLMTRHPWRESRDSIHLVPARASVGPIARSQIDTALGTVQTAQGHGYATVGLVLPDAANVEYATERAEHVLGIEQSSRPRLRIGEPRSFQGIEVDAMVIVTGVGQGASTPLATERLDVYEDPNTLNTVITRARYDVYVIIDHPIEDLPRGLWRAYLESESKPPPASSSRVGDDAWKQLLAAETHAVAELPVVIDYRVGPHTIDLVVGPGRLAYGVFTAPHPDGPDAHIDRYLALRDLGWKFMHILEQDWLGRDPDAVMAIVGHARRA